jgi:hypothetical protein
MQNERFADLNISKILDKDELSKLEDKYKTIEHAKQRETLNFNPYYFIFHRITSILRIFEKMGEKYNFFYGC